MTSEERDLITGLFNRLRTADSNNQTPKDQEASQLIGQLTGQQPSAPYLLVQTLLVQEHALNNATARIRQLEQQAQQAAAQKPASSGGFLSGLFGHSTPPAPQNQSGVQPGQMPPPVPAQPSGYAQGQQANPPYPTTANMSPSAGGGFLKGALGTAAGVAGGALLFQGIQNLLGHNSGPFGGFGGFGGSGGHSFGGADRPDVTENVVNNYYGNDSDQGTAEGGFLNRDASDGIVGGGFLGNSEEPTANDDAGSGGSGGNFTDAGFDSSNPFAKDDNFGLGGGSGQSLDNNYDSGNTDANNDGGLFSGGGDDDSSNSGGDDSSGGGNDDSYA